MEIPIKMDDLGGTTIFENPQIIVETVFNFRNGTLDSGKVHSQKHPQT